MAGVGSKGVSGVLFIWPSMGFHEDVVNLISWIFSLGANQKLQNCQLRFCSWNKWGLSCSVSDFVHLCPVHTSLTCENRCLLIMRKGFGFSEIFLSLVTLLSGCTQMMTSLKRENFHPWLAFWKGLTGSGIDSEKSKTQTSVFGGQNPKVHEVLSHCITVAGLTFHFSYKAPV